MKVYVCLMILMFSSFTFAKQGPVQEFHTRCNTLIGGEAGYINKTRISSIEVYSIRVSDYEYSKSLQLDFIDQKSELDNKLYIPIMNNGMSEGLLINLATRVAEQNDVVSVCYNKQTNIIEALKIE
ncbi:hypothetical protein [Enterobacter cancerogenus]|uniref:hypothetical protein n=1 Tax=Enterobacter cancerogenus TaxID=69218 RepID=UPI0040590703